MPAMREVETSLSNMHWLALVRAKSIQIGFINDNAQDIVVAMQRYLYTHFCCQSCKQPITVASACILLSSMHLRSILDYKEKVECTNLIINKLMDMFKTSNLQVQ